MTSRSRIFSSSTSAGGGSGPASSIVIGTTTVTDGTEGSVLFVGPGTVLAQDNANFFWDGTNNRLGIHTNAPADVLHIFSDVNASVRLESIATAADSRLLYQRARGTKGSKTILQADDEIGRFTSQGYDGSAYRTAAEIKTSVDGTPGASDMPGRITFWTTADGGIVSAEKMRLNNAGNLGINSTSPGAKLDVRTDAAATKVLLLKGTTAQSAALIEVQDVSSNVTMSLTGTGAFLLRGISGTNHPIIQFFFDASNFISINSTVVNRMGFLASGETTSLDILVGALPGFDSPVTGRPMIFKLQNSEKMRIDSAGNVGIGGTANANAILDVQSTTKAFMPPRMTTTQRDAIASPTAGMVIYNSTLAKLNVYTTAWETVTSV